MGAATSAPAPAYDSCGNRAMLAAAPNKVLRSISLLLFCQDLYAKCQRKFHLALRLRPSLRGEAIFSNTSRARRPLGLLTLPYAPRFTPRSNLILGTDKSAPSRSLMRGN